MEKSKGVAIAAVKDLVELFTEVLVLKGADSLVVTENCFFRVRVILKWCLMEYQILCQVSLGFAGLKSALY